MDLNRALDLAKESLRREAFAEHSKNIEEAQTDSNGALVVTCDMCVCGMSTGMGASDKCGALERLFDVRFKVGV